MKNLYKIILLLFVLSFCACSDIAINPGSGKNSPVLTVDSAGIKFELWNLNEPILYSGYNDIGFKVFINGVEKKTGFVKYKPVMYHTGGISHTTPVCEYFYYDEQKSLFMGYACFLMASDTSTSFWFADYNYNDEMTIKQNQFSVSPAKDFQMRFWVDINTMIPYSLSIISPKNPVIGSNEFKCILHKRDDNNIFIEIDSAEMFIISSMIQNKLIVNNQNPVWIGGGKYLGSVNFTSSGKWVVSDSIKFRGNFITGNILPKFFFDVY
ncbi:MAG: hypothetical protein NTU73_12280 [Ignavibacteriae bacterium]|nr:hypothetical protein [Ignavibacteriota bacterium]